MFKNPVLLILATIGATLIVAGIVMMVSSFPSDPPDYARIQIGMTNQDVKAILGEPVADNICLNDDGPWCFWFTKQLKRYISRVNLELRAKSC